MTTVPGFSAAALLTGSGEILGSSASSDVDLDSMIRGADQALRDAEEVMGEIDAGRCRLLYLEGTDARVLAQCVKESPNAELGSAASHLHGILVLKPEGQFGMGKLRLAEAMAALLGTDL